MAVVAMGAAHQGHQPSRTQRAIRDAVTGETLTDARGRTLLPTAGRQFIRVSEERVERSYEPVERTPIPRVMDTAQPYPGGRLGGKRWHPEFTHYIGELRPRAVEEADRIHREWWRDAYARARVLKGFIARHGPDDGARRCAVALASLDHDDAALAAVQGARSAWWVRSQVSAAYHFAFAKFARCEQGEAKRAS